MFLLFPIIYVSVNDGLFIIWYILWITFRSQYYIIQYQCFKIILKHRLTIFPLLSSGRMSTLFHNFSELFSSFQSLSQVWLFGTPWTAACQASLSITNSWSLLRLVSIELVMPFNHLILCRPLLLLPSIFPSIRVLFNDSVLVSGGQSIRVSASASVLLMNIQDWFPLGLTVWSPCSPRDSQKSSPTLQFKSIISSTLSFLYGPTLTSTHDYWKNHRFD